MPQTCCKLWIWPACCKLSTNCENQTCCNLIFADLLQVVETTCIKLVDKKSWQSTCSKPVTTCSRLVIIKTEQAMQTHSDIGLMTARERACSILVATCVFLVVYGKGSIYFQPHIKTLSSYITKVWQQHNFVMAKCLSFLYICMVNTIYLFSFVETPCKFIIAELSICKLGSSSVLIIRLFEFTRPFL